MGYIALGMFREASEELHAIPFAECSRPDVLSVWVDLHFAEKKWDLVEGLSRQLVTIDPENVDAWVSLGFAVRRTGSITAARDLLLAIAPRFEKHAVISYNLACYHCVLGEIDLAKTCLAKACRLDPRFRATAMDDSDLQAMWDQIRTM